MPQPLSHTPGPWGLVFAGKAGLILVVAPGANGGTTIAAVDGGIDGEPNARLIAAAPELAAAVLAGDLDAARLVLTSRVLT